MITENTIQPQRTWQVLRMDEVVVGDVVDTSRPGPRQITRVESISTNGEEVTLHLVQAPEVVSHADFTIDVYR